ncbi:MAG: 50S ribosomal protein L29 [Desulfovibrio sp.]|nr:50S ribosomal protein L29 [Desulfovibrio sp.]
MPAKSKTESAARPSVSDLRSMTSEDLQKLLRDQREELMQSRFKHATAQLEKTSELKAMRRQVARISTILTEKEQRA